MMNRHTYRDIVWIDLESPTAQEARALVDEFGIHPLVAEELLAPSAKPKVDFYGNAIYCILHFPAVKHTHTKGASQEIDFVVGKKFLITTHYDTVDPLHKFSKIFEVNSVLDHANFGEHAGYLFYYMVKKLYKSLVHELESVRDTLDRAENEIFKGQERAMVIELSRIARDLLTVKRAIALHGEVLESFRSVSTKLFDADFDFYLHDLIGEFTKVKNSVQSENEFLVELRSTNNSLLSTKQNEVMRTLTVVSAIMLPSSLIAAIFTIPANHVPIVGKLHDFWIISILMVAASLGVFLYFKRKRWL